MGYIFRIVKTSSRDFICDEIKYLSTSKEVIEEMGEPLLYNKNQWWHFAYIENKMAGFIAYSGNKILYAYTMPEFRNKGVFHHIYNSIPSKNWETIASNMSYPIFLSLGFKVVKNYKTCHKLKLT